MIIDNVEKSTWFTLVGPNIERPTQATHYTDFVPGNLVMKARTDLRRNFFSTRLINIWNNFPVKSKDAKSLSFFKSLLDDE